MRTQDQLHGILREIRSLSSETEWVEFKEAKETFDTDVIGRYFSALSNEANLRLKDAGWLVFGVSNKKGYPIVGSNYRMHGDKLNRLKMEVAQQTNGKMSFVEIYELDVEDKRIVLFEIPPAPLGIPTSWKGHFYGRDHESLTALSIDKIERIRNRVGGSDWSAELCPDARVDDLSKEALAVARLQYKKKYAGKNRGGLDELEIDGWSNETFLSKTRLLHQKHLTKAALLLLGTPNSSTFLSPAVARITWVLRDDQGNSVDYLHIDPPFLLAGETVFARIQNFMIRSLPDGTLFPEEVQKYDGWVVREALHNCIAHQDYRQASRINIVETSDSLTLSNCGSFLPGSLERVLFSGIPPEYYRNPLLAHVMVHFNMIDTIGSGIRRMFQRQRERYFPLPDYGLFEADHVTVTISGRILDRNYTRLLLSRGELDLETVILLDKVQKGNKLEREQIQQLRAMKLVEGRYPNVYVTPVASPRDKDKIAYIRNRGFDQAYYKKLILEYCGQYRRATRKEISQLLSEKLPNILDDKQKYNKISVLLGELRREGLLEKAGNGERGPSVEWRLTSLGTDFLKTK